MFQHHTNGFTLLELVIVISIIAALLSVLIPKQSQISNLGKKKSHEVTREMINAQLALYYLNNDSYPTSMSSNGAWSDYGRYFPDGVPASCNQGSAWSIHSNGYLNLHSSHE